MRWLAALVTLAGLLLLVEACQGRPPAGPPRRAREVHRTSAARAPTVRPHGRAQHREGPRADGRLLVDAR
ncbi:MAG: hypothetical protein ACOZQL_32725 [Myxococcota bacterium]